ncbi:MAG: hypothetical protein RR636_14580 [Clostridium sp.]
MKYVDFFEIKGNHKSILNDPFVKGFADAIKKGLKEKLNER